MRMNRGQAKKLGIDPVKPEHAHWGHKPKKDRDRPEPNPHALFDAACRAHGLPVALHEVEFHPTRGWRFDHLFEAWLAVEIQGGLFTVGRHVRGAALRDEYAKLNEAVILGYAVLLLTPEQVKTGEAFAVIKRALCAEGEQP